MKITLMENALKVEREDGPKIYSESALFYQLKKALQSAGHDVIKKAPDKDGHLTSAPYYLRARNPQKAKPGEVLYIHHERHQIEFVYEPYNQAGEVYLSVERQDAPEVYKWTGPTGKTFIEKREPDGTYYRSTAPRAVIDALQEARRNGARVRLFYGDTKTGQDWKEESDVSGHIGRTTGHIKIPLLIPTTRSHGGHAILTDCIVRLLVNGREVYRHPKYRAPVWTVHQMPEPLPDAPDLTTEVHADGEVHARFTSPEKAARYIEFMTGRRATR